MEGNVVVFDRANQRIGFAPSNISHVEAGPCGKRRVVIIFYSLVFPAVNRYLCFRFVFIGFSLSHVRTLLFCSRKSHSCQ